MHLSLFFFFFHEEHIVVLLISEWPLFFYKDMLWIFNGGQGICSRTFHASKAALQNSSFIFSFPSSVLVFFFLLLFVLFSNRKCKIERNPSHLGAEPLAPLCVGCLELSLYDGLVPSWKRTSSSWQEASQFVWWLLLKGAPTLGNLKVLLHPKSWGLYSRCGWIQQPLHQPDHTGV